MNTADIVLNRVIEVKKLKNDAALARFWGVKPNTLSNWRNRNVIPYNEIIQLCEHDNISLDYVLAGVLPVYRIMPEASKTKGLTTAGEPEPYKINNSYKERIVCEPPPVSYNNNITPEIQPVIDAVIEVMTSDNEIFKTALTQNAFAFQLSVRSEKKVSKLENDIKEIKRVLGAREDDFKTLGPQGEEKQGGGEG